MDVKSKQGGINEKLKSILKNKTITMLFILIAMCLILGTANPNFFLYQNLMSLSRIVSYTAVIAIGELFAILIACIDLSVGAVSGLGAVVVTILIAQFNMPLIPALFIALMTGVLVGLCNAGMVIKLRLPAFIATMGSAQVIKSLTLLMTDGKPVLGVSPAFIQIGQGYFLFIPIAMWILVAVAVILSVLLSKTVTGRRIYALGGGEETARFSGIKVNKLKTFAYIISGSMAALCGVILASRMGSAQAATGEGYQMEAVAAVIIGGASFSGGEGTIAGTIIGACIMTVIRNALVMLKVSTYVQSMIIGFIIIIAVSIDQLRRHSALKKQKRVIAEAVSEQTKQ